MGRKRFCFYFICLHIFSVFLLSCKITKNNSTHTGLKKIIHRSFADNAVVSGGNQFKTRNCINKLPHG
jgi:hypothetical protein